MPPTSSPPRKILCFSVSPTKSHNVLPKECIICRKKWWRTDWATVKWCPLPLVVCERINADNFLRAAEKRKHTRILTQIRGKDMVAIEVRYHKLCYRKFVRCTEQNQHEDAPDTCLYSASFNELCAVVEKWIVQGKELLRLSTLNNVFTKIAKKVEGVDASGYKSTRLKKHLKDAFPQLLFVCPHKKKWERDCDDVRHGGCFAGRTCSL